VDNWSKNATTIWSSVALATVTLQSRARIHHSKILSHQRTSAISDSTTIATMARWPARLMRRTMAHQSRGVVEGHERYALPARLALSCLVCRKGKLAPNAKLVAGFEPGLRDTLTFPSVDRSRVSTMGIRRAGCHSSPATVPAGRSLRSLIQLCIFDSSGRVSNSRGYSRGVFGCVGEAFRRGYA
jgi:hypothetical protein